MGEIVIVGGGLTAARVAQSYRESGGTDRVTLLACEPHPPYHRPPLTKRLLRGEAEPPDTLVATPDDFRELDVELRLGTPAASLDLPARTVTLGSGRDVAYERLVIATGAAPRRLPVPGPTSKASAPCARSTTRSRSARPRARLAASSSSEPASSASR